MPIFFQHQVNDTTRLGIWKIEENEDFFKNNVPLHRDVTHPHKRLQHLAGRFLLQYLFPAFPYTLIQIADTRKPFIPGDPYHFSISHCGDFAAAIVSRESRVGIDIEIPVDKLHRIKDKFLGEEEQARWFDKGSDIPTSMLTLLWSCKESVFKWYGDGQVDFREHIQLNQQHPGQNIIECLFSKSDKQLNIDYRQLEQLVLAWVCSKP
ncbi:MAG: 4'-phosphopantetheinyl transferase superfamily protein [Chitinophagaceae bacterium]|nr:MAG: 4'-phosphopantetheinyl transferase superfamily protein [Chitinophagaceae bacterium]